MTKFLELNRHKLSFAFKATSLLFTLMALIICVIGGLATKELPDFGLVIYIFIYASIGLPLFILGLAYIEWVWKRRVRNKAFKKQPFDELDKIGFTVSYINKKSKWSFTEETKEMEINGYRLQCDSTRESPNTIEFKAFIKQASIEIDKFKRLKSKFKQDDIYFYDGALIKQYNLKRNTLKSIEQLKNELTKFIDTLMQEELEPEEKKYG